MASSCLPVWPCYRRRAAGQENTVAPPCVVASEKNKSYTWSNTEASVFATIPRVRRERQIKQEALKWCMENNGDQGSAVGASARTRHLSLLRVSQTAGDEAGRYEGIPLAFMSYAQRRAERLVLAIPLAKRSQTLSCSGIIRTCCRCLKYYLTAKNTASPANSPSWLDLDPVPLLINGELPALKAATGAVYWPDRMGGGAPGLRFAPPSGL